MKPFIVFLTIGTVVCSCKKYSAECQANAPTVRQISNKPAVIKLNATIHQVYIIEQGSIDSKLVPCNFPMEFYQNDLQVVISGDVKLTPRNINGPCCTENFVISKITR